MHLWQGMADDIQHVTPRALQLCVEGHSNASQMNIKRHRSPCQVPVATPAGTSIHKRQRALQPLPGLSFACNTAEGCRGNNNRPAILTNAGKSASETNPGLNQKIPCRYFAAISPLYAAPHSNGAEPASIGYAGPERGLFDKKAPPSALSAPCMRGNGDCCMQMNAATLSVESASGPLSTVSRIGNEHRSFDRLASESLPSDMTTSGELCKPRIPQHGVMNASPTGCAADSPCFTAAQQNPPGISTLSLQRVINSKNDVGTCGASPVIISDGSQYLAVTPRSLVTPRNNLRQDATARIHQAAFGRSNSCTGICSDEQVSPLSLAARAPTGLAAETGQVLGLGHVGQRPMLGIRRLASSPSDDDGSPSFPSTHSPAMNTTGEQELSSVSRAPYGRLVCNLIDRFNSTQFYDGVSGSP